MLGVRDGKGKVRYELKCLDIMEMVSSLVTDMSMEDYAMLFHKISLSLEGLSLKLMLIKFAKSWIKLSKMELQSLDLMIQEVLESKKEWNHWLDMLKFSKEMLMPLELFHKSHSSWGLALEELSTLQH